MIKSLWIKFLILLLAVSLIALSAALILRGLMIRDFREYLEGEREDRVYWITADLEAAYEKHDQWSREVVAEDAIWALMLGFEVRLLDMNGSVVMDTESALASLSPLVRKRVLAMSSPDADAGPFVPYPLFLGGKELGRLEVRFLKPRKENVFIARSDRFLLVSLIALGGLALLLSIIVSRKLTLPVKRLASAAAAVSEGDLKVRVEVSDRDELGKLSETFNSMARTLETQEDLRKKLLSNTAHELRTPVGAMRGELEGMIDGLIPADREQMQSLYEETDRLKKILDGMEELAQAQASGLMLKKQPVTLRPFLSHIIERAARSAPDKELVFNLECDEGLTVHADPDRLAQILMNLLGNAAKAIEKAGAVTVSAARKGAHVELAVRDTGAGIRPEHLPFIFERFFRASGSGLGLGLAIVKELVEAHGGKLAATSEWGRGSSFTVRLPYIHNSS